MIHRKKNRPALQRHDILTVSLVSFFCFFFLSGSVLFSVLHSSILFKTLLSRAFFFFRSLSTQLFFLVVFLLLILSTIAFSYVGLLSLFCVQLFHAVYLGHLPPRSFLEELSSEQFAEIGSIHLLPFSAWASSLAFLSSVFLSLAICRAIFIYLVLFSGSKTFLSLVILLISPILRARFSQGGFMRLLPCFSPSGSVLSSRSALSSENAYS